MLRGKLRWMPLFVFGSVLATALGECPNPILIKPCICTKSRYPVTVKCSNFTSVSALQEVFNRSDRPFKAFILEYSHMMYLPSSAIMTKGITQITIANSRLMGVFDMAAGENNKVSHLTFINSTFQRGLQWPHVKVLSQLIDFTAEDTEIRKLDSNFQKSISPNLEKLQLVATKTRTISDTAFQKMTALKTIMIQENMIKTLKRSMFPTTNNIFIFDFSYNHIETLPDDLFTNAVRIREVLFVGNRIKTFNEATFGGIIDNSVVLINLNENPISCDCSFRWFLYKERYVSVRGICASPMDKAGKSFRELRRKDYDYCPK